MSKRMLSSHVDEAVEEVAVIVEALEVEAEELWERNSIRDIQVEVKVKVVVVVKVNQDQLKAIVAREHFKVAMEEVVHQGVAEEEEDHHMETVEEEDQHVEIGEKVEDNHQYKPIMPKENQLKRKKILTLFDCSSWQNFWLGSKQLNTLNYSS